MYLLNISLPEQLLSSDRTHNRIVREVMTEELTFHHETRMREHFKESAAAKYQHEPRSERYRKFKERRFHSRIDNYKSGRTKNKILGDGRIVVSGAAAAQTLVGRLTMRLPFVGGTGKRMDEEAFQRMAAAVARGTDVNGRPIGAKQLAALRKRLANSEGLRGRTGVTADQIILELRRTTPEELRESTERMGRRYIERIKTDMKRPRLLPGAKL